MKLTKQAFLHRFMRKIELGETTSLEYDFQEKHYMILGNKELCRVCLVDYSKDANWPEYHDICREASVSECLDREEMKDFETFDFEEKEEYKTLYVKGDFVHVTTPEDYYGTVDLVQVTEDGEEYAILHGPAIDRCTANQLEFDHRTETIEKASDLHAHFRASMGFCCE